MFTPQAENYYTRLGIHQNSQESEIKAAFLKAVRQHPPEQDPENFKQIREAYDTLINAQTRQEYDSRLDYGPEIEILENQIKDASEENDLDEEIRLLKKLLNIAPDMSIYRNRLGLVFLENEEPDHAFSQFERASTLSPDNHIFVLNMGYAAEARDSFQEAEFLFVQAGEMEKDDYSPSRALAGLYFFKLEEKNKAYSVLEDAIQADGKLDFRDLFCIWDKIHFAIFDDKVNKLKKELKRVTEIAKNKEERQFAIYLLWEPSLHLYDAKRYDFATKLLRCARTLDPSDKQVKKFYETSKRYADITRSFNAILDSTSVHDFVKHLVALYVSRFFNEIDDDDWVLKTNEVREVIVPIMSEDPDCSEIKQSLRYVKKHHKQLFETASDFFGKLINAPEASRITYQCPKCGNNAIFGIGSYGEYTCPKCNATLLYDESGVTEQKGLLDSLKSIFFD